MSTAVKPMPLWQNILYFGVPSALTSAVIYKGLPWMVGRGFHPFWAFMALTVPLVGLFVAALVAYGAEGRAWEWASFKERMRLRPMVLQDWGWAALAAAVNIGGYIGLNFTTPWLGKVLWEPPAALDKVFSDDPKLFAGVVLHGAWWFAGVYLVVLFFNIAGEELWWRGIIQPRQEARLGRHAWILQAFAWTCFHIFWAPDLIRILPGALMLAYLVQKRENTWIAVVAHSTLNILGWVHVMKGVLG